MMKTRPPLQWPFSSVVLEKQVGTIKGRHVRIKEHGQEAVNFPSGSIGEIRTMLSVSSLISWTNFYGPF